MANELSIRCGGDRRRAGRLCGGDPGGAVGAEDGGRRAGEPGRRLPELGLRPHQGADPQRRGAGDNCTSADYGFTFDNLRFDFGVAVKRSRDIVGRQTKGVGFLMKKNKIDVIEGQAGFVDAHTLTGRPSEFLADAKAQTVTAANFIVATGARARSLPGTQIDGKRIIQYRDAVVLHEVPKKLIVVGSGAIGMEFAYVYGNYGAEVTVIEMLDQVLPLEDAEVAAEVQKAFNKRGVKMLISTRTEKVEVWAATASR